MKIAIVGSRGIMDRSVVEDALTESPWFSFNSNTRVEFISGGADGVDTSAEMIANDDPLIDMNVIKPDYSDWSRGHPAKVRNTKIVEQADAVVAVWDGNSNGTRDTIDKALDRAKPMYVKVVE